MNGFSQSEIHKRLVHPVRVCRVLSGACMGERRTIDCHKIRKPDTRWSGMRLLTQVKTFNQGCVPIGILATHIIQQATSATDQHQQTPSACIILAVRLQVIGQFIDPMREHSNLDIRRTSIPVGPTKIFNQFSFLFFRYRHESRNPSKFLSTWVNIPPNSW